MTESLTLLTRDLTIQQAKEKRLKDELTECQNTIASHQAVIKLIEENDTRLPKDNASKGARPVPTPGNH